MAQIICVALLPIAASHAADAQPDACPPPTQTLTETTLRDGLTHAADHGFIWRISKDGRTSFLYGTIHAAKFEWMFPGPTVYEALRSSDTLALELDVLDPDIRARLVAGTRPTGDEKLPPALTERIARLMASQCVDAGAWSAMAPELQIASLSVMVARRDGFDPAYAIDLVLDLVARDLGKPVVSLESPEGQMQALRAPDRDGLVELVTSGLDDLESGRERPLLLRIANAWTSSDYAELASYESWCECLRTPADRAAMKRLLDDRNPGLADAIDALHASGKRVFAAVGSLHMTGANGLPALMRQRGYKVEQGDFPR